LEAFECEVVSCLLERIICFEGDVDRLVGGTVCVEGEISICWAKTTDGGRCELSGIDDMNL
jgi:hypothetical protein